MHQKNEDMMLKPIPLFLSKDPFTTIYYMPSRQNGKSQRDYQWIIDQANISFQYDYYKAYGHYKYYTLNIFNQFICHFQNERLWKYVRENS